MCLPRPLFSSEYLPGAIAVFPHCGAVLGAENEKDVLAELGGAAFAAFVALALLVAGTAAAGVVVEAVAGAVACWAVANVELVEVFAGAEWQGVVLVSVAATSRAAAEAILAAAGRSVGSWSHSHKRDSSIKEFQRLYLVGSAMRQSCCEAHISHVDTTGIFLSLSLTV